jgi:hypothetical protein
MSSSTRRKKNKKREKRNRDKKRKRADRSVGVKVPAWEADAVLANAISDILIQSAYHESDPPDHILSDYDRFQTCASREMQTVFGLLPDAIRFLNQGEYFFSTARDREALEAVHRSFLLAGKREIYDLLYLMFCMQDISLTELDVKSEHQQEMFPFLRSLFRVVATIRSGKKLSQEQWLFCKHVLSIRDSYAASLRQFLNLKSPSPSMKAVQKLDSAVNGIGSQTRQGRVLSGLLRLKLGLEGQPPDASWQAAPKIYKLLAHSDGVDDLSALKTFQPEHAARASPRLQKRVQEVDISPLTYDRALQLLVLQLRCLYGRRGSRSEAQFQEKLHTLVQFLIHGVPPECSGLAENAQSALCKWLVERLAAERNFNPGLRGMHKLAERRPDDYRAQALYWLTTLSTAAAEGGKTPQACAPEGGWKHVNFNCFYQGFVVAKRFRSEFRKVFFDPLSLESKKSLILQCSGRAFAKGIDFGAWQNTWNLVLQELLSTESELVRAVTAGRPCEPEFLVCAALSLVRSGRASDLSDEQIRTLLRFGEKSLAQSSTFLLITLYLGLMPVSDLFASRDVLLHMNGLAQAHAEANLFSTGFQLEQRFLVLCKEQVVAAQGRLIDVETTGLRKLADIKAETRRLFPKPKPGMNEGPSKGERLW